MGKKRSRQAAEVKEEPVVKQEAGENEPSAGNTGGMTALEAERAALIARNRERLLALGIPSLVKELQGTAAVAAGGKPKKKRAKSERGPRVKREAGAPEQPSRRSSRLQEAAEHEKEEEETAEEQLQRELGQAVVEGQCPRCGKALERGHRQHLLACTGVAKAPCQPRPRDADDLADLDEEDRRDAFKRTLARMKKLHLDGLISFSGEEAKFAVLGSTGNHYTVTLKSDADHPGADKHTCTCLDYRFRRRHCKHICLVLTNLDILERPAEWHAAVEQRMDELVAQQREREAAEAAEAPRDKNAEVALKFL